MIKKQWNIFLLSATMVFCAHGKNFFARLRHNVSYLVPPVLAGATIALAPQSERIIPTFLGVTTAYSLLFVAYHRAVINNIKAYYATPKLSGTNWAEEPTPEPTKHFCLWRQYDTGTGETYWATASQLEQNLELAKEQFLSDLYAGVFLSEQGELTPHQMLLLIHAELQQLQVHKSRIARCTTVYWDCKTEEDFAPEDAYWGLIRPNYNKASKLYIRLNALVKRLKIVKKIVGTLYKETGHLGWPVRPKKLINVIIS